MLSLQSVYTIKAHFTCTDIRVTVYTAQEADKHNVQRVMNDTSITLMYTNSATSIYCYKQLCFLTAFHIYNQNTNIYLLSNVLSVCTSLHSPFTASDLSLTLTSYAVPASSAGVITDVAGGEPVTEI